MYILGMNNVDRQYMELCEEILNKGVIKEDRTGTGTKSIFDWSMCFDMSEGLPILTSKKIYTRGIIHELIWFLRGDTNIRYLLNNDVHIWDGDCYKAYEKKVGNDRLTKEDFIKRLKTDSDFCDEWGDLGPIYGHQWRHWGDGVDQIDNLVKDLLNNPDSRRLMVSAWNVSDIHLMTLPPCHYGFQCYTYVMSLEERCIEWCRSKGRDQVYSQDVVRGMLDDPEFENFPKRKLSLKWNQRSIDTGIGLGFNITSYAILLALLAREVNMIPDKLYFSGGDCHLYINHLEGVREQLSRPTYKLPKLELHNTSIFELEYEDITVIGYESSPVIKLELSN